MMEAPQFYIRFEEWAQAKSRSGFALLVGVGSAVGLLVVSPLFNDIGIVNYSALLTRR
ncbi:hypothetical protein SAMN04489841_4236 [Natrinema salaciae]|uniref:Uncharacterized protein n=1 Tax=Natrinema salaciae TaxID=1186196 RepID=A0A1H9R2P6_9EURY|nr:hypothetical protein SAMN04489841_4236 [Natrinema salaciae]